MTEEIDISGDLLSSKGFQDCAQVAQKKHPPACSYAFLPIIRLESPGLFRWLFINLNGPTEYSVHDQGLLVAFWG